MNTPLSRNPNLVFPQSAQNTTYFTRELNALTCAVQEEPHTGLWQRAVERFLGKTDKLVCPYSYQCATRALRDYEIDPASDAIPVLKILQLMFDSNWNEVVSYIAATYPTTGKSLQQYALSRMQTTTNACPALTRAYNAGSELAMHDVCLADYPLSADQKIAILRRPIHAHHPKMLFMLAERLLGNASRNHQTHTGSSPELKDIEVLYHQAASLGHIDALCVLFEIHLTGKYKERHFDAPNPNKAYAILERMSEMAYWKSVFSLANQYATYLNIDPKWIIKKLFLQCLYHCIPDIQDPATVITIRKYLQFIHQNSINISEEEIGCAQVWRLLRYIPDETLKRLIGDTETRFHFFCEYHPKFKLEEGLSLDEARIFYYLSCNPYKRNQLRHSLDLWMNNEYTPLLIQAMLGDPLIWSDLPYSFFFITTLANCIHQAHSKELVQDLQTLIQQLSKKDQFSWDQLLRLHNIEFQKGMVVLSANPLHIS